MEGTAWGDQALDMREAAAYCKYSEYTWRTNYLDWQVPHERVGGRPCFLKGELDKWMANRYRLRIDPKFLMGDEAA